MIPKPKSEFSRNVLTLMTGTTIAQAIPIAISPILTRIYTPEDFGIFALYMAISSIVAVVATGRYELAIMLPKKDENAINIVVLSFIISFFISFVTLVIVFVFNSQITHLLGNEEISHWLYLIPVSVLLTGLYQSLNYWSNRKKQYKRLTISRIVQSTGVSATSLGMGFSGVGGGGLILGTITGQGLATGILGKMIWKEDYGLFKKVNKLKMFSMARRYIKFPKYQLPGALLNTFATQIPILLLTALFNISLAGFYDLGKRIIGVPLKIVGKAIADVFRQHAMDTMHNKGDLHTTFIKMSLKTLLYATLIALLIYPYLPNVVEVIFGKDWIIAGEMIQILLPMYVIRFATVNYTSVCIQILEILEIDLIWQIGFLSASISSFIIGWYLDSWIYAISLYSFLISILYLISWIIVFKKLKKL